MEPEALGRHVSTLIETWLAYHRTLDQLETSDTVDLVVEGRRIIDGGQEHGDRWKITDHHTGEVLASGSNGYDEMTAAWLPEWWHIDAIGNDAFDAVPQPDTTGWVELSVPTSLVDAIGEWVTENQADAEALRAGG